MLLTSWKDVKVGKYKKNLRYYNSWCPALLLRLNYLENFISSYLISLYKENLNLNEYNEILILSISLLIVDRKLNLIKANYTLTIFVNLIRFLRLPPQWKKLKHQSIALTKIIHIRGWKNMWGRLFTYNPFWKIQNLILIHVSENCAPGKHKASVYHVFCGSEILNIYEYSLKKPILVMTNSWRKEKIFSMIV